ncbi:MAG: GAF domain-containing protein [Stenomitos frigidus ULC029]
MQQPLILTPRATVLEAVQHLSQSQSGCILVMEQQQLVGICTEQDCLRAIAAGISPEAIQLEAVMTQSLITLSPSEALSTAWQVMQKHQIAHLPIVDDQGRVLGVITERNLLQAMNAASADQQQANITLQAANQRLTTMFASIPAGFHAFDRAWRFTHVNQHAEALLQKTQQELLGKTVWEAFPEAVGAAFDHEFHRAMATQVSVRFEAFYKPLNTWFEVYAYPSQDELFVYYQDVTERRRFYDQLQLQTQREQALNRVIRVMRNSLHLTTVFETATAEIAQLLQADRADIICYQSERLVWKIVSDSHYNPVLNNLVGMEFPDDANEPIADLKRFAVVQIEDIARHPDPTVNQYAQILPGTWLLVPIHFEATLWGCLALTRQQQQPWQTAEVELACVVVDQLAIAIQQSQLYQQVRRLNENLESQVQERTAQLRKALAYEALLKRITDRVRDSLDEHHILQTTMQELAAELGVLCCDTGLFDLEHGTLTIAYEAIRSDAVATAKGSVLLLNPLNPVDAQTLQGQWAQFCSLFDPLDVVRQISYRFTILSCPITDDQGVLGDIWLFKPCDECFHEPEIRLVQQVANQCAIALRQSRLYQEIQAQVDDQEQLNDLKDNFLSSVSHELRTPMSNIKMATQMLEIALKQAGIVNSEPNRLAQYFKVLKDESEREIRLINDLLDLSQVESGIDALTLTTVDLHRWLAGLASSSSECTWSQEQQLLVDVPAELPPLTTDFRYLERAITELLQNACKYTAKQETICVFARAIVDGLQIGVSNTGTEIAASEHDRIFEKFYRIPNADPWKYGGTGLGLALVKRLVERLGASIQVKSADRQTTFVITFAIAAEPSIDKTGSLTTRR